MKISTSKMGHLSKMTTEASTHHLLGEEAIPKGRGASVESLNFERVTNSYSIATRRQQLLHLGLLLPPPDSEESDHNNNSDSFGYFHSSIRMSLDAQQRAQQRGGHAGEPLIRHSPTGKQWTRWFLTISAGLACGCVAIFILYCVQRIGKYREARINYVLGGLMSENQFYDTLKAFLEYAGINLGLAWTSSIICLVWAPLAVGSGIPEVKAYLNGVCVPRFAKVNVFLAKIFATIMSVTSGLIVGPEGPLVHIGAIIGQGITKTADLKKWFVRQQQQSPLAEGSERKVQPREEEAAKFRYPYGAIIHEDEETDDIGNLNLHIQESTTTARSLDDSLRKSSNNNRAPSLLSQMFSHMSQFRNDHERRDLISIAVACGFACAFGAPVGGLLYSMEEASSYLSVRIMWRTLVATALGTLMISVYYGSITRYSVLSLGIDMTAAAVGNDKHKHKHISYEANNAATSFMEIPIYVLIGAAAGLLGALFNANYEYTNKRRKTFYGDPTMSRSKFRFFKLLEVAIVSLVTSILTFVLPVILPWACTSFNEIVEAEKNTLDLNGIDDVQESKLNCPEGMINEIGSILLGSRDEAMNEILTDPTVFEARTLLTCGLTFYFLMLITFGIDIPSGMFMPTLITGSNLGGWAGIMIQRYIMPTINPATIALLGATGMLAGIQRSTVSLVVIMMEATGKIKVLIPLIVTVIVARYVGDLFNDGVYHIGMHLKGYPYLDLYVKSGYDIANVTHIMTTPVVTLKEIETVARLVRILKTTTHNGFPVVDASETFVGLIRRDQIVALIECGIYTDQQSNNNPSTYGKPSLSLAEDETDDGLCRTDSSSSAGARKRHKRNDSVDIAMRPENEWYRDSVLKPRAGGGGRFLLGTSEIFPVRAIQRRTRTRVHLGENGCLVVDAPHDEVLQHVDIAAAMNCGARSVMERCPISQAYVLYATCGLRHLTVLGSGGRVSGIITRKNLDPDFLEEMTGIGRHDG